MDKKDTRVIVKRILKDYIYQHKVKLLVSFFAWHLLPPLQQEMLG